MIPELHLDGFGGPMDLLNLAEWQCFDPGLIPVLDLVEQFVAAIDRLAGRVTPKRQAEWLVLAARLRMRAAAAWLKARRSWDGTSLSATAQDAGRQRDDDGADGGVPRGVARAEPVGSGTGPSAGAGPAVAR